nr:uncharacterized protein LOC124814369 [Hydra vulgaris]
MNDSQDEVFYEPKSYFTEKMTNNSTFNEKQSSARRKSHRLSSGDRSPLDQSRNSSCQNISTKPQELKAKRISQTFLDHISQQFKDISITRSSSFEKVSKTSIKRTKSASIETEQKSGSCLEPIETSSLLNSSLQCLKADLKRSKSDNSAIKLDNSAIKWNNFSNLPNKPLEPFLYTPDVFYNKEGNFSEILI